MKSSLSLFTKLLQQVFKKNHGSLILLLCDILDFAFSKNIFLRMCISIYYIHIFFIFSVIRFTRDLIWKNIWLYKSCNLNAICCMLMIFFLFFNECLDGFKFFWKKNNEMKILDVAKCTQMRSSQNTILTLVKVKYDCDKMGYRLFCRCPMTLSYD